MDVTANSDQNEQLIEEEEETDSFTYSEVREAMTFINTEKNETKCRPRGYPTNWKAMILAGIVTFLSAVESTIVGMSEWPYMKQIDPSATSQFYGVASSLSKAAHAIFALIFSFLTYKTHSVKISLIIGRIIALAACILYLCVELFPQNRRIVMMFCYILFGIGSSSAVVMRVYMVYVSTKEDRARAFAFIGMANLASIIIGPLCQLAFAAIRYPGAQIVPGIRFHLYSAPVWVATVLTIVAIIVIKFFLIDLSPKDENEEEVFEWSFANIKKKFGELKAMNLVWSIIVLCWIEKIISGVTMTTIMTVSSPMQMVLFNLSGHLVVLVGSICAVVLGVIAVGAVLIMVVTKITQIIHSRFFYLFSLLLMVLMYLLSYPYPFDSTPVPHYNATTQTGCNPKEYSWCDGAIATSLFVYIPVMTITFGLGFPIAGISLDTIYSHLLENVDQTLLQGAFVVVDDIVQTFGPLYSSAMFTQFGQAPLWLANGCVTIVGVLLWTVFMRKLKKHT